MSFLEEKAKRRRHVLVESGVEYTDYACNFIEGCFHGCTYPCYSRLTKMVKYEDWIRPFYVQDADVKLRADIANLPRVVRMGLERGRPPKVMMSTSTDAFQITEVRTHTARTLTRILLEEGFHVLICTKSHLVAQDPNFVSLLAQAKGRAEVGFTIISLNEQVRQKWEPRASPIFLRLRAIDYLKAAGVPVWLSVEPIQPYSNDWMAVVHALADKVNRFIFGKLNYSPESDKAVLDGWWAKTRDSIKVLCHDMGVKSFLIKAELENPAVRHGRASMC